MIGTFVKIALIGAAVSLSACAISIKNASVSKLLDGTEVLMTGEITGNLFGDSPFTMQVIGANVVCKGATNRKGQGSMTCSDGRVIAINVPKDQYRKLNGSYVYTLPDGTITAIGWGKEADFDSLRKKLAEYPER